MGRRRRYDDDEGDDDDYAPRRRDDDYDDDDYDAPPRRRRSGGSSDDVPGVVGLVCGGLAVVCFLVGCAVGCTWFAVPPLSLIGLVSSFFARGNLKVAGLVVNGLMLLLSVVAVVLFFLGIGMLAAVGPPQPRAQ